MAVRIGINGFGRMGRIALRRGWAFPNLEFVLINEVAGDARCAAHLLAHDSLHGRWPYSVSAEAAEIDIDGDRVGFSQARDPSTAPWSEAGVDIVLECTGQHRTPESVQGIFDQGIAKVLVSSPVKRSINLVRGVNESLYRHDEHHLVGGDSCTTNALGPVVKVLHQAIGIRHGAITSIHATTNTQSVLDSAHDDLRRARAAGSSLIPTTTGAAKGLARLFPDLAGRLTAQSIRVPVLNASLTECVFEVRRTTTAEEINQLLHEAANDGLRGILGFEEAPLVSADYLGDIRSSIVDALSTRVTGETQIKILVWHDSETGYVQRFLELLQLLADKLPDA